jgi:membrane-associated phospholipid phosphatase
VWLLLWFINGEIIVHLHMLAKTIRPISLYLTGLLAAIVLASITLIIFGRIEFSYRFNQFHHPLFDVFAKYITHLGDGFFVIGLCIIWIYQEKKTGWYIFMSYASSALITQLLKRTFFADMKRPISYINKDLIHLVEGVTIHSENTFPSGHATTIFALTTALALVLDKKWQLLLLCIAVVVALTRVYLIQHFISDIMVGAVIGTTCAILFHHYYYAKSISIH